MIKQPYPLTLTGELDVYWDFAAWVAEVGDALASFNVAVGPGLTKVSDDRSGSQVEAWIRWTVPSGGVARSYVDCEVTTAGGRKSGARRIEIVAVPARGAD